jgi:pimeloyl-ACP methyl ester carboxylesterase
MESVVQQRSAWVVNYFLGRRWVAYRDELVEHLRDDLKHAPHVVLVGYSMGACAAVDVVKGMDPDEEMVSKLSLVLVAPAARLKPKWARIVPASEMWAERWNSGVAYLQGIRSRRGVWERFIDRRVRLLYNHDDGIVMPEGFRELELLLPKDSTRTCPGLRHIAWRKADLLHDTVLDLLATDLP